LRHFEGGRLHRDERSHKSGSKARREQGDHGSVRLADEVGWPDLVQQRRDIVHVGRPSHRLQRTAPCEPATVDQDDPVLVGERTLLRKGVEAPAEAAVDEDRRISCAEDIDV
jgi:hypothetical protein